MQIPHCGSCSLLLGWFVLVAPFPTRSLYNLVSRVNFDYCCCLLYSTVRVFVVYSTLSVKLRQVRLERRTSNVDLHFWVETNTRYIYHEGPGYTWGCGVPAWRLGDQT